MSLGLLILTSVYAVCLGLVVVGYAIIELAEHLTGHRLLDRVADFLIADDPYER